MDGPTTRLRLRVHPGASSSEIVGPYGDAWKVRVTAPPEDGKANEAVRDLLAAALGVSRADTEVVGGAGSRDKIVAVQGLSAAEAEKRLRAHA